jgi:uncharacterized membrane protein HdeD (DUF308 family)
MPQPTAPASPPESEAEHALTETVRGFLVTVGVLMIVVGGVLTLSGIFSIIGLPMLGVGIVLVIRGLF